MVKSRLIRATAVAAASAGLIVGFTGLAGASSGSIMNTGPDSTNKLVTHNSTTVKVHNYTNVGLNNSTAQSAYTGSATVKHNTTGDDATSGDAKNSNGVSATLDLSNSTPSMLGSSDCGCAAGGTIDTTGPDSLNLIVNKNTTKLDVHNTTNVSLDNSTAQTATSGKASVTGNTTGGSATSGDASNTNNASFDLTVSN